jgi:hypothetical protein
MNAVDPMGMEALHRLVGEYFDGGVWRGFRPLEERHFVSTCILHQAHGRWKVAAGFDLKPTDPGVLLEVF